MTTPYQAPSSVSTSKFQYFTQSKSFHILMVPHNPIKTFIKHFSMALFGIYIYIFFFFYFSVYSYMTHWRIIQFTKKETCWFVLWQKLKIIEKTVIFSPFCWYIIFKNMKITKLVLGREYKYNIPKVRASWIGFSNTLYGSRNSLFVQFQSLCSFKF